jgi:hypothetical protein
MKLKLFSASWKQVVKPGIDIVRLTFYKKGDESAETKGNKLYHSDIFSLD